MVQRRGAMGWWWCRLDDPDDGDPLMLGARARRLGALTLPAGIGPLKAASGAAHSPGGGPAGPGPGPLAAATGCSAAGRSAGAAAGQREDFEPEQGQTDGTLAHALERWLRCR